MTLRGGGPGWQRDAHERARGTRLAGRIVIVVGAGSIGEGWGNGKASAVAYAREGATVVCVDFHLDRAEETVDADQRRGRHGARRAADATDEASVQAVVDDGRRPRSANST